MSSLVFTKGSKSWAKAESEGFEVYTSAEAAKKADIIMILINDEKQAALLQRRDRTKPGSRQHADVCSWFQHPFRNNRASKDVDVTMIAPKAPGHTVRSEYVAGKGTPCLDRCRTGCNRQSSGTGFSLCTWYRRCKSRCSGNNIQNRNRN